eukprot:6009703-Alexandrium_andersonii.AAC.1
MRSAILRYCEMRREWGRISHTPHGAARADTHVREDGHLDGGPPSSSQTLTWLNTGGGAAQSSCEKVDEDYEQP